MEPSESIARAAAVPLPAARARSFWPSEVHERLLVAALAGPTELPAALAAWRRDFSLERVDHATLTILPLLYRNLARHGVDPELQSRLKGIYRWSWHKNQLLLAAVRDALACLREDGIEAVLMKGLPLALATYQDLGARFMGDADVVVSEDDVPPTLARLARAGWVADRTLAQARTGGLTGLHLKDARGRCIDLHWHVLPESFDAALDRELLATSASIDLRGEPARCLAPCEHLLEIVCHGLCWAANTPLHWVADAKILLDAEPALDWDRFVALAARSGRGRTASAGLSYLARRFDAAVPAPALRRLERLPHPVGERLGFWFASRSDARWPWGRVPLVAGTYLRNRRARRAVPQPIDFLRFLSARASCTPREWVARAAAEGWRKLAAREGSSGAGPREPHRGAAS